MVNAWKMRKMSTQAVVATKRRAVVVMATMREASTAAAAAVMTRSIRTNNDEQLGEGSTHSWCFTPAALAGDITEATTITSDIRNRFSKYELM